MKLRFSIAALFMTALFASDVFAVTYYVGTSGNNANACTTAQSSIAGDRKRSINGGLACMSGSDTLIVGNGTYEERLATFLGSNIPSGTAGNPTIIQAENRLGAIIKPNNAGAQSGDGWYYVLSINTSRSYITFDGFDFDASLTRGAPVNIQGASGTFRDITVQYSKMHGARSDDFDGQGSDGVDIGDHANPSGHFNINFNNNEIYNNLSSGDVPTYGANGNPNQGGYGIYLTGHDCTFEKNHIHDNGSYGIVFYDSSPTVDNNIIRGNNIHDSLQKSGILISMGDQNLIYNNLSWGNAGDCIQIGYSANLNRVLNNTCYNNSGFGVNIDNAFGVPSNTFVQNNIMYMNASGAIRNFGTTSTCTYNLGVTSGEGSTNVCTTTGTKTQNATNPSFVAAGSGNFLLNMGSPAIGAGTNLLAYVTTDYLGLSRTVPFDDGAYRFSAGGGGSIVPITVYLNRRRK